MHVANILENERLESLRVAGRQCMNRKLQKLTDRKMVPDISDILRLQHGDRFLCNRQRRKSTHGFLQVTTPLDGR